MLQDKTTSYQPAVEALRQLVEKQTVKCLHQGWPCTCDSKEPYLPGRIPDPLFNPLREALREKCPCLVADPSSTYMSYEEHPIACKRCYLRGHHSDKECQCNGTGYVTRTVEGLPSSAVAGLIVGNTPIDVIMSSWLWVVLVFQDEAPATYAITTVTEAIQRRGQEAPRA